jgi:hypothetical protein
MSDGVFADEDIRDGKYWARFTALLPDGTEKQSEWMPVPDEAILTSPNSHGQPVVWWTLSSEGGPFVFGIRCYAPGAKG